jgi:hypothetical protein
MRAHLIADSNGNFTVETRENKICSYSPLHNWYVNNFHLLWYFFLKYYLFVCFWPPEQFFSYPAAVIIASDRAANLDLCYASHSWLLTERVLFRANTFWDTGPRCIRSHPKDRHQHPTVGYEPETQGSPDLYASALTTAPRGRLRPPINDKVMSKVSIPMGNRVRT